MHLEVFDPSQHLVEPELRWVYVGSNPGGRIKTVLSKTKITPLKPFHPYFFTYVNIFTLLHILHSDQYQFIILFFLGNHTISLCHLLMQVSRSFKILFYLSYICSNDSLYPCIITHCCTNLLCLSI